MRYIKATTLFDALIDLIKTYLKAHKYTLMGKDLILSKFYSLQCIVHKYKFCSLMLHLFQ